MNIAFRLAIVICALYFVSEVTAQVSVGGAVSTACPLATPVRCPNSGCVNATANCPVNNCTGLTPYLCSDSTCAISNIYCNCQGVICSDGSCKRAMSLCPIMDGCPELFPRRCPDGTCQVYNNTCSNDLGTNCPSPLQLCLDGICRTAALCTALPYYGCPIYQCPNGNCASTYSQCYYDGDPTHVLCYDGSDVPIGTPCAHTAPGFINAMNITVTIATDTSTEITVPSATSSTPVASITVPEGTVSPQNGTNLNTISVNGVSTSAYLNSSVVDPATGNTSASASVVSSAINVNFGTGQSVLNNSVTLSFPNVVATNNASVCVASLLNSTWTCVNNTVVFVTNGTSTVTSTVRHFSTYAVVIRPTCIPSSAGISALSFCNSQTWANGTIGYFCADGGSNFFQCLSGPWATQSGKHPCATGTSCSCCAGEECSDFNLESPCRN